MILCRVTRHPPLHFQLHRGSLEMAGDYKPWSSMHVSIVPLEERKSPQQLQPRLPNHALAGKNPGISIAISREHTQLGIHGCQQLTGKLHVFQPTGVTSSTPNCGVSCVQKPTDSWCHLVDYCLVHFRIPWWIGIPIRENNHHPQIPKRLGFFPLSTYNQKKQPKK